MTMRAARQNWRLRALAAACLLTTLTMNVAQADDWSATGNVAMTSDYVYRGISQTDENPALQGGFDIGHASGFYAGIWGSNVDFNDSNEATVEIDYYAGFKGQMTDALGWDAGLLYYTYPGADDALHYDCLEGKLGLGYTASDVAMEPTIGLNLNYSPEYSGHVGDVTYVGGTLGLKLSDALGLKTGVGHQDFSDSGLNDWTDWKLGLTTEVAGVGLELAYTDTDLEKSECNDTDICEGRVLLTASKTFE